VERNCKESVLQLRGTETVYSEYSELAGSLFVTVKINGLGNFLELTL